MKTPKTYTVLYWSGGNAVGRWNEVLATPERRTVYWKADQLGYGYCPPCAAVYAHEKTYDEYTPEPGEECERCARVHA